MLISNMDLKNGDLESRSRKRDHSISYNHAHNTPPHPTHPHNNPTPHTHTPQPLHTPQPISLSPYLPISRILRGQRKYIV